MIIRCLNVIDGHSSTIQALIIFTCLTTAPDIFFLTFSKNDNAPHFSDVDSKKNRPLPCAKSIGLNYERQGGDILQILDAGSQEVKFVSIHANGNSQSLEVWSVC